MDEAPQPAKTVKLTPGLAEQFKDMRPRAADEGSGGGAYLLIGALWVWQVWIIGSRLHQYSEWKDRMPNMAAMRGSVALNAENLSLTLAGGLISSLPVLLAAVIGLSPWVKGAVRWPVVLISLSLWCATSWLPYSWR